MGAPMVYVKITEPLPGTSPLPASDEINPLRTAVEIATEAGGYGTARVGMLHPDAERPSPYPGLPKPVEVRDKAHVEVSIGGFVGHEGIVQRYSLARDGLESLGYGLAAMEWGGIEEGGENSSSAQAIAIEAIRSVDWLTPGKIDDTGSTRVWNEVRWQAPSSVIQSIINEGNGVVPFGFYVYEQRVARIVALTPPSRPDYLVAYDRAFMSLDIDVQHIIDGARVSYVDASGVDQVTDYAYRTGDQSGAGASRGGVSPSSTHLRLVTISGSADSGALAALFARAYVAMHSSPRLSGTITYTDWQGPEGYPGYMVRAGQWIGFGGNDVGMVTATSSDLSTGVTQIQIGEPSLTSLAGLIRRADETIIAMRRKVDPVTGAKLRYPLPGRAAAALEDYRVRNAIYI